MGDPDEWDQGADGPDAGSGRPRLETWQRVALAIAWLLFTAWMTFVWGISTLAAMAADACSTPACDEAVGRATTTLILSTPGFYAVTCIAAFLVRRFGGKIGILIAGGILAPIVLIALAEAMLPPEVPGFFSPGALPAR